MLNLHFSYGIYDQPGELIKGNLKGYGELARELYRGKVACYLRSEKEEFILGCRFEVQIIKGRKERVIFIAKYPIEEINLDTVLRFYEEGIKEIESLERLRYKVLGLWEDGDLEKIKKVKPLDDNIYKIVVGKLVANEKINVKSSDVLKGVLLFVSVAQELKPVLHMGFRFILSRLPLEGDMLICSEEWNKDINLDTTEIRLSKAEQNWSKRLYQIYNDHTSEQISGHRFENRKRLADEIIRIALMDFTSEACKFYQTNMNKLFQPFIGHPQDLIRVINHIVKEDVSGIEYKTAVEVIKTLAPHVYEKNYENVESFLSLLYKGVGESYKRKLQETFIEHDIFLEKVVNDIIKRISEEKDQELFHILARKSLNDPRTAERFNASVTKAVDSLSREESLGLLKFALDELEWESGKGGKILVKALHNNLAGYNEFKKLIKINKYRQKLEEFRILTPARNEMEGGSKVKNGGGKALVLVISFLLIFSAGMWVGEQYAPFVDIAGFAGLYQPPNVIVDVTPDSQRGAPGGVLTYMINLTNKGTADDVIGVESIAGAPQEWEFELKNPAGNPQFSTLLLSSNENYSLTLRVHIPAAAIADADIEVKVRSTVDINKTNISTFKVKVPVPPSFVSGLNVAANGSNWIHWTWTNQPEEDFSHTEVWLNGEFKTNTSENSYNATSLDPKKTYEISTRRMDKAGNINQKWINNSATTS
ncbi:MAG: hypothetical protein CHKLHMKO_00597 [Candidatus Argoarchaeum ethanivorans]|uniref:Fibronectin type-III domain-containing protein n=1 Tax=Candidatus Argoarchaeum ethanivorans TaxID=2608793 RepID=A0A811TE35_9EURY|nr:MAG: hypothetical protein CHKLHMKO_00597 [Candidatus Argoarchaeum ethanivorans]